MLPAKIAHGEEDATRRSVGSHLEVSVPWQRCVWGAGVCVSVPAGARQPFTCCSGMHGEGCRNADSEEVGLERGRGGDEMK